MNKKLTPAEARKAERLAAALRENLKRRKAQVRARAGQPESPPEARDKREPGPENE
jgi:hypothetical protein